MKKFYALSITLFIAAFLAATGGLFAETITSSQDGNWNVGDTWVGGNVPTSADSVVVSHLVSIINGDSCMHLYVAPAGYLRNLASGYRTLVITGNLWVDGTLAYTNYSFSMHLGGNLHNNGTWSDVKVYFTGTSEQVVSASPGKNFDATDSDILFQDEDPVSPLKFTTDLTFIETELIGNGSTLEFVPGIEVTFDGEPIRSMNIIGNNATLTMQNGAFLEDSNLDNLTFDGVVNIGNDNSSSGELINAGTMQNLTSGYRTLTVNGNFTNNGTISEPNYALHMIFLGNVANNGAWTSSDIFFDGSVDQQIVSSSGSYIYCDLFTDRDVNSKIILDGDMEIRHGVIDLDYATMDANGHKITMRDGAYVQYSTINQASLGGKFRCYFGCEFTGTTIIVDTLENRPVSGYYPLTVQGKLINNGIIRRSNSYAYELFIHDDFEVNGPVDLEDLTFAGVNDQTISSTSKGGIIDVEQVYDTIASSAIIFNSDITFVGSNIDLDGATINLNNGALIMQGGNLRNGSLTTYNQYLRQSGGAAIYNMHFSNVELRGICQLYDNNSLFTNVTVTDTLQNHPSYNHWVRLSADGAFINNGTIRRSDSYAIQLYIHNDFINNGPIDMEDLVFAGINDQNIYSTSLGGVIDVDQVSDTVRESDIIFNSDMTFYGAAWNLDSATIILNNGSLIMQGGNLGNGFLTTSNNKYLRQSGNAKISNMHFNNVELKGICKLFSTNNYFTDVTVTDTLMNHQDWNNRPVLFVDGDFVNNGVITNSDAYTIDLRVNGNYYNNGNANYYQLVFTGDDVQHFTSPVFPITDSPIESTKTGGLVQCDDEVLLSGCTVSFNWDVFSLQNGDLKVTGGVLQNVGINGNGFKLISDGNGAASDGVYENLSIEGHLYVGGTNITFDDVTLTGTISQRGSHNNDSQITTTGDFINNGHIIDIDTYDIWFYIQDVVINNGEWTSEKLVFDGDDMHYIESLGANPFQVDDISISTKGGDVTITDELFLLNTDVNLSGQNLYIPDAGILDLDNSSIQFAMVYGADFSTINGSNNSWFSASTFNNVFINGTMDTRASTYVDCVLEAVMQNDNSGSNSTIEFEGDFTNNGSIINRPSYSYELFSNVLGHVYNYGTWEIEKNNWQGLLDQDIYLMDDSEINTPSEFYSMIGTAGYQWYKNDSVIDGETINRLDFAYITVADRGYYHCETDEGTSRTVRICTKIEIDLADEAYFCQYESVMIEATPTSGEGSYTYSWTPTEGLSDPNIANPLANPTEPTVYFCTITDAIGCKGEASIFVQQYPQLYVDAGEDDEICYNDEIILPGNATGGELNYTYSWEPTEGLSNPNIANPTASPEVSTTYTLTVTDGNGCVESDQMTITVHPLPSFSYETSDTVVCYGEEITYTEYFTGTAPWTVEGFLNGLPDTFTTYNNPDYYTFVPSESFYWEPLTVTDGNGCTSPVNQSVNVTVHPLPTFTYELSDTEVCFGEEVTFTNHFTGTAPWTVEFMYNGVLSSFTTSDNPEYFTEIFDETTLYEPLSVTDATNCSSEVDQPNTIIVNPRPVAYQLSSVGPYCWDVPTTILVVGSEVGVSYLLIRDGNTPEFTLEGTGSPIEFNFIPGEGIYTVRGTNTTTDCENMMIGSIIMEIDYAPEIVSQLDDDQRIIGSSKTWIAEATGTDPLTYNWYFEGDLVQSGPSNTYTKTNLTLDDTGEYWFVVENLCGEEQSASMYFTVLDEQPVTIPAGWSGISTYLNVWDDEVDDIFQYVLSDLIIVNDFEHMYWPGQNINTYTDGLWDTYTGAQIKMSAPATVDFQGLHLDDFTVELDEAWTYLPVLHQTPVPADDLFMQTPDQVIIAKDIAGTGVYWPQYGINTLDMLNTGLAYLVKVSEATEVDFSLITKSGTIGTNEFRPQNVTPWNNPVYSNSSHTIALPKNVATSALMNGDWIGVFNAEGICCGIVEYNGTSTAIPAFGNDNTTYETDGLLESEWMNFKAYRPTTKEIFDLTLEFDASANESGYFVVNGMSVISGLKAGATGTGNVGQTQIRVYPNPTNGVVFIEGISLDSQIEITNAAGQVVYTTEALGKQSINLGNQATGLYSIRITNQKFTSVHKVMVE